MSFHPDEFSTQVQYGTAHSHPFANADALADSFNMDISFLTNAKKHGEKPCRIFGGTDTKLLKSQHNEILWTFNCAKYFPKTLNKTLWNTTLNGLKIKPRVGQNSSYDMFSNYIFPTSADFEEKIRYGGVNCLQYDVQKSDNNKNTLKNNEPYYFNEVTKAYILGTVNMKNTAHPGLEEFYQDYPKLASSGVSSDHIKKITKLGQDLEVNDIVEPYVPFWDTNPVSGDIYDPTKQSAFWGLYKYTLPTEFRNSGKFIIRYRKACSTYRKKLKKSFMEWAEKSFKNESIGNKVLAAAKKYFTMKKKKQVKHGFYMQCTKAAKFGQDCTFIIYRK
jgi:hypothetical protein